MSSFLSQNVDGKGTFSSGGITTIHQNVCLSQEPVTLDSSSFKIYILFCFVILEQKCLLSH